MLCFGPDAADYRVELFSGYHADRDEPPDELAPQFDDAGDFFGAFGWVIARRATRSRPTTCSEATRGSRRRPAGGRW